MASCTGSGATGSQCGRLEITDVALVAGTVFVRVGHGRKDRVALLSACPIRALGAYLANGQRAGIPGSVHPRALRHSCATHLLKGGADVRQVQKILGQKSLRSTMLDRRVDTSDLKRVIEQSHPREKRKRRRR